MSAPAPCRPAPVQPGHPVDEEEIRLFQLCLIDHGYKESTVQQWVSRIRTAYAHGVTSLDDVDATFENYAHPTRSVMRRALQELDAFRKARR